MTRIPNDEQCMSPPPSHQHRSRTKPSGPVGARSQSATLWFLSLPAESAGCGCHGHGVVDVAVRMKTRRGSLTEPSQPQARPSRRRCDPGIRHSLTEEHGPVEDSTTVAPRNSLHESAGFWSLVAERPPKVAVGFHPRSAIPPNHLVAERRLNHRHTLGRPMNRVAGGRDYGVGNCFQPRQPNDL